MASLDPKISKERRRLASSIETSHLPAPTKIRVRHCNMTAEKLVERFRVVYGNEAYDYSKVTEYKGMLVPVTIGCNRCGNVFEQIPTVHLRGCGCKKCGMMISGMKQALTLDEISAKLELRGKLRYVSGEYINQKSILIFACLAQGHEMNMLVYNALSGKGCAKCQGLIKHTNETFWAKVCEIHGPDTFDGSEVVYVNNRTKVWVTCRTCDHHYEVRPHNIMRGKGCPVCNPGNISKPCIAWLNSLNIPEECREFPLTINEKRFRVDALVGTTVYEFDGDYFHGNPARFPPDKINHKCGLTMRELLASTLEKRSALETAGYTVVSIWESDWLADHRVVIEPDRVQSIELSVG